MQYDQDRRQATNKKIMIVAGEASGDLHGSHVVRFMKRLDPTLRFYGVGGEKLREAGVDVIAESSHMAVVGLTEVLSKIGFILSVRRKLKQSFDEERPELVILIDYPDFNLPLAKAAHQRGIKVFYYISPQVWAWRKRRIYQIARWVDRMAVILPFEPMVYEKVDLDVRFVGHPLLDVMERNYTDRDARRIFGLREEIPTVALLPGSRESEVTKLLPEMLMAAELLKMKLPSVQFVMPRAAGLRRDLIASMIDASPVTISVVDNNVYDVIGVSDCAIVASGTATMETALLETPMIIIYKVSPFSYYMGRRIIRVDHIGMVNIIAGKRIVPEFIQGDAHADNMADEVYDLLTNDGRRERMKQDLKEIRTKLGSPGAAEKTARFAYELIS
ncbi:MAG: lipid-A-disaccharide synthase [Deltaproteobacteria bacterium]|nr:lipid-A-disaccharide synthase [Deltaproteobacteria bacterium]MBN2688119.1 lipid-A-disaccharide synthase [Deltaproteobacteria bacterium]